MKSVTAATALRTQRIGTQVHLGLSVAPTRKEGKMRTAKTAALVVVFASILHAQELTYEGVHSKTDPSVHGRRLYSDADPVGVGGS